MKYIFASDLHGSAYYCKKLIDKFNESGAQKMIFLGDLLYHGPRNFFPEDYDTKEAFQLLNEYKDKILTVRGNCDADVDQMVLEFPVLADYAMLVLNDITFHLSHGHLYCPENLPPMEDGEVFVFGHIHEPVITTQSLPDGNGKVTILNPGSASLPKGGYPNSYALLDDRHFTIYDFDGNVIKEAYL